MHRRAFVAGLLAAVTWRAEPLLKRPQAKPSTRFEPCLNQVTTLNAGFEEECAAYAAAGFKRIELWFPKLRKLGLPPSQVAATLRRSGLQPVSACASGGLLWRGGGDLESRLPEFKQNMEMAQALEVPRYVVFDAVSGNVSADDYKVASERLARIAELASAYKVKIAFEFIARSALVGSLSTALSVLRAAGQANAGLCLDTFHFFASVSKFEDLDLLRPQEVEHVHFHDVPASIPRERLTDRDRVPPGEGIIPLPRITAALRRIGYSGALSTELFGPSYQNGDPAAIARRCFNALRPYV